MNLGLLDFLKKILYGGLGAKMGSKVLQVLWKISKWNFSEFCMTLQQHTSLKIDLIDCIGKNFVFRFFGQNRSKMRLFKVLWKIKASNFSDFLHKVTVAFRFNADLNWIFWLKSWSKVLGPRKGQTGPKWGFSKSWYAENSNFMHEAAVA